MMRTVVLVLFGVGLASLAGCGGSGPKTYTVMGTAAWEGKPIPEGQIIFVPVEASLVPDAGPIKDGRFELQVKPGKMQVQIHADRETGPKDPIMGVAPRQSYIPAKYNHQTTLTAEVTPDLKNEFTFHLPEDAPAGKP